MSLISKIVGLLGLSDIIEDIYSFNYSEKLEQQKNERVSQTIDRLTSRINQITNDNKKIVNELFGEFIIEPFGSSVNGFYMHGKNELSDLDISINFYYNPAVNKEKVLQTILPAIDGVSKGNFILIFESKVPLIKYTDFVTKEEGDLGVNGTLGVMNSKLIKTYASIDIRYHKMGYFLKYWSKHWKLIGADNGYLSSYAFQLMIIAFLQGGIENPILPNLLDFDSTKYSKTMYYLPRGSTEYVCETNGYFISNHKQCKSEIEKGVVNDSSTAELVYHFFNYYLNVFNVSKMISLKHGGFCDKLNSEDTIAFSIVDPFQIEHNPGQSVKSNSMSYKIIGLKFKDIIDKIENGEGVF